MMKEAGSMNGSAQESMKQGASYPRFMAMVGTSTVIMLGLMYLNTYQLDHVMWSETRFWMMFMMGGVMAAVMLAFMWSMYRDKAKNIIILAVAVFVFLLGLFLMRSQVTIDDSDYMSAMIPHHSIAIMTSERAGIDDPRVRELADGIIRAQRKEIKEMKWLLNDIKQNGKVTTAAEVAARPVPAFEGKLNARD